MSSPINVIQHPLQITPSKVEHIYSFTSTTPGNNPTYTDFRFVADIWVDTTTTNPTKIARKIFAPNSYGVGTINVQRIIENYVEGNARTENAQYTSYNTNDNTVYAHLANLSGTSESNGWNGSTYYPSRYGVRDYRIMIGEQYRNPAVSNDLIVNISEDATFPHSGFNCGTTNLPWTGGASDANSVNWYEAGGNIVQGIPYVTGVDWAWTNSSGTFVYDSDVTTDVNGTFTPSSNPSVGDKFVIEERYTGIRYRFNWYDFSGTGGFVGWGLIEITSNMGRFSPDRCPPFVTIWPGTSLKEGSMINDLESDQYWQTAAPNQQQDFWEVEQYHIKYTNPAARADWYGKFLTTFGPETRDFSDNTLGDVYDSRRRRHHPECPILVSFFFGRLSNQVEMPFFNNIEQISVLTGATHSSPYEAAPFYENDDFPASGITLTQQNDRIYYHNLILPELAGGRVAIWCGTEGENGQWDQAPVRSELVEYYLEEDNCLSDPVHVLFLNRQGVFDTYTFDKKAIENKRIKRETYAQGGIRDTEVYAQLSTERRDVVFNQDLRVEMDVETWYLEDNDKQIIMDLFQSPEVYIIKNQSFYKEDGSFKLPKTYNPYLLPVTVKSDSIKEFKNRYNKVFQYEFSFEYSPINEYRTQG